MKNPFQQPFAITEDYIENSLKGFSIPIVCINFNGNSETRGIGTLLIVSREMFTNHEDALVVLMQRMLCENENWEHFSDFTAKDVEQFTQNFLNKAYNTMELNRFDVKEFEKEYRMILNSQITFTANIPQYLHIYNDPWFGIKYNKENITDLNGFNPLNEEKLETSFYFKDEWDCKEYFAISKNNYIYFDWFLSW